MKEQPDQNQKVNERESEEDDNMQKSKKKWGGGEKAIVGHYVMHNESGKLKNKKHEY